MACDKIMSLFRESIIMPLNSVPHIDTNTLALQSKSPEEIFSSTQNPSAIEILCDVDGTLLSHENKINDELINAFLAAGITDIYLFSAMSAKDPHSTDLFIKGTIQCSSSFFIFYYHMTSK